MASPEPLEPRAAPGGGVLELLFAPAFWEPFFGSVWADSGPSAEVALPGVSKRNKDRLAALASLREDELALGAVLGEVRRVLETSAADQAMSELYVATARERLKQVAESLADPGADLASRPFLARLWWVDELLTALARARTGRAGIASLGSDGGMALLDEDPPNLPPVAQDDGYELKHDTTLSVPALGVMTNDYDPLGDTITASLVSGPSHAASFSFGSDGSFSYTPSYHFVGTDSFVYQISDGQFTDSATVLLDVWNMAPVAQDDGYEITHDTELVVAARGVRSNDYDHDGDEFTAVLASYPQHAAFFDFQGDGSFQYTPAYHFVGTDSFTYYLTDGIASSAPATVTIEVQEVIPFVQILALDSEARELSPQRVAGGRRRPISD